MTKTIGGLSARKVDAVFDKTIKLVGEDLEEYSCIALHKFDVVGVVRNFYTDIMSPNDSFGYDLAHNIESAYKTQENRKNLRVVMLSLVKAAWRDLV